MAKMFYSMEEAAEKLGMSAEQLKQLSDEGKLQQFRDRDKVMYKVEQVDKLAGATGGGPAGMSDTGDAPIDLAGDSAAPGDTEDSRSATGISVFDAGEVDAADPGAQTVVTGSISEDDELALESVGSGSGLLDLTRESDDTSLGAELLDEIYPAGGSDAKVDGGESFEGIFDAAGGAESAPSGLGDIEGGASPAEAGGAVTVIAAEPSDPVASGWTGGLMLGALAALVIGMIVVVTDMGGSVANLATMFAGNLMMYAGGLLVVAIVFAVIGMFMGKAGAR